MKKPTHDVIIAGAGPVGLFLACELALFKCKVLVFEKAETPNSPLKQLPFGIRGLNALTIDAFDRRGLLEHLELHKKLKNPHKTAGDNKGAKRQAGHFAGIPILDGNIDLTQFKTRLPSSPETNLISTIEEVEIICARRAEGLGVEIKRGQPIEGVDSSDAGVTVHAGGTKSYAKWFVGCDGGRSRARKACGFEFVGTEPEFTGYSLQVEIADGDKLAPGRHLTERGMYMQSQPGYVVIADFDGGAGHTPDVPLTRERVEEVLRGVSGLDVHVTKLIAGTTWTDRAKQVTTYRKGRVFLAGDAAHIHSPLGGQGLNLGLGDAMNLGWKLAATIHGRAPESLLDTYHAERHPLGLQVLEWSRAQVSIMRPGPAARAMNAIVRDLMSLRDGATYMAGRVWGVNTHYDLGGDHPLVGHSVPNFEFEDGRKVGELMLGGRGMMIDFGANPALKKLAERYGLHYVSGRARQSLGLRAVLARPDGFIAWASEVEPDTAAAQQAVSRWFKG